MKKNNGKDLNDDKPPKEIIQWGCEYLLSHGYSLDNNFPEIIQDTPWSYVIRFTTSEGYIYLKNTPELLALEANIIKVLQDQFNAPVPKIIANNAELNCFLMKDAGRSLREVLKQKFDEALLIKSINQFTELQIAVSDRLDVFLNMGVPDWRLDKLPGLYKELISQKNILMSDGLSEIEVAQLESLLPMVSNLCRKLSGYSIKPSIVQPDFNDNNTLVNDATQAITIIDLGEVSISHPFFSLINLFHVIKKHYELKDEDNRYLKIKHVFLENYRHLESESNLLDAFEITNKLFFIYSALCSYRLMMTCDKSKFTSSFQRHGRPGVLLKEFIILCATNIKI